MVDRFNNVNMHTYRKVDEIDHSKKSQLKGEIGFLFLAKKRRIIRIKLSLIMQNLKETLFTKSSKKSVTKL